MTGPVAQFQTPLKIEMQPMPNTTCTGSSPTECSRSIPSRDKSEVVPPAPVGDWLSPAANAWPSSARFASLCSAPPSGAAPDAHKARLTVGTGGVTGTAEPRPAHERAE